MNFYNIPFEFWETTKDMFCNHFPPTLKLQYLVAISEVRSYQTAGSLDDIF